MQQWATEVDIRSREKLRNISKELQRSVDS